MQNLFIIVLYYNFRPVKVLRNINNLYAIKSLRNSNTLLQNETE